MRRIEAAHSEALLLQIAKGKAPAVVEETRPLMIHDNLRLFGFKKEGIEQKG